MYSTTVFWGVAGLEDMSYVRWVSIYSHSEIIYMYYNTIVLETEYGIAFLAIGEICVSTRNQIYLKLGPQLYAFADDRLVPVNRFSIV